MNKVNFYFQSRQKVKFEKVFFRKAILQIVQSENVKCIFINVIFCNDAFLKELNLKYLNHNYLTDVLTFDYSENFQLSGEIYISLERVKDNSENYKKSFENELARVVFHGVLHLCGYKDKSQKEKILMTEKEDFYLAALGIDH